MRSQAFVLACDFLFKPIFLRDVNESIFLFAKYATMYKVLTSRRERLNGNCTHRGPIE